VKPSKRYCSFAGLVRVSVMVRARARARGIIGKISPSLPTHNTHSLQYYLA